MVFDFLLLFPRDVLCACALDGGGDHVGYVAIWLKRARGPLEPWGYFLSRCPRALACAMAFSKAWEAIPQEWKKFLKENELDSHIG